MIKKKQFMYKTFKEKLNLEPAVNKQIAKEDTEK